MRLNRYQKALTPGTPEATAAHCICPPGTTTTIRHENGVIEQLAFIDPECRLHGIERPEDTVPSTW